MSADIASLGFAIDTSDLKSANQELKSLPASASAAEQAVAKFSATTMKAANSNDQLSRRAQRVAKDLDFERQQLVRSASEREKYAALRRAGVAAMSAEGTAIAASVAALQAQRSASKTASEATTLHGAAIKVAGHAASEFVTHLKYLALAYVSVEGARKLWEIAMKSGDLGEQAEQIGINTDQLQAYRLAGAQAGVEVEAMDAALVKLASAMGSANEGNKEMIEFFNRLKVNLLDAKGELRPVADVLPEIAKGILAVGSSSQRTSDERTAFGKSGAKMATVLADIAKGNDALIQSAREQNAITSPAAIAAWDELGDRLKVTQQKFSTLVAEFGARFALPGIEILNSMLESTKQELEGILSLLNAVAGRMAAAKRNAPLAAAQADESNIQDAINTLDQNKSQFGYAASRKALVDRLAARQAAVAAEQSQLQFGQQGALQAAGAPSSQASLFLPQTPLGVNDNLGSKGVRNPTPKATGGGSDPYKKAIEFAKEYTALKNEETAAVGLNVAEAERLKHTQELVNKASEDANKLSPTQRENLKSLAAAMADADAKFKTAKFMDDEKKKSEEFIASQQIEQASLFMSTQAAMAYRIEQEALNKAKADGINLTDAEKAKLKELAGAQAASAEKTRAMTDAMEFSKETVKGFITDMRQGLQDGKSLWESFGDAALNVLDKIANKLMDMAINDLFSGGNSSGGFLSAIGGIIGSLFGGAGGGGGADAIMGLFNAKGNAFNRGNVIPFARGGIVSSPTIFPMARGMGLMGEAGPEAVMPLSRGRNGNLGVTMHGGSQQSVVVYVTGDTDLVRVTSNQEAVRVVNAASPKIENNAVNKSIRAVPSAVASDHAERGGDFRT